MASIQRRIGDVTFNPRIGDFNSGGALGRGNDALTPRVINDIASGFSLSVTPVSKSTNASGSGNIPRNASARQIQSSTPVKLRSASGGKDTSIVRLRNVGLPYFQNVPDLGKNPSALTALSAGLQFQSELETVGGSLGGIPAYNLQYSPNNFEIMGQTQSFINTYIPHYPGAFTGPDGLGAFFPGAQGVGSYFPPEVVNNPFNQTSSNSLTRTSSASAAARASGSSTASSLSYPGLKQRYFGVASNSRSQSRNVGVRNLNGSSGTPQAGIVNDGGKFNQGQYISPFGTKLFQQNAVVYDAQAIQNGVNLVSPLGFYAGTGQGETINLSRSTQNLFVDGKGGGDIILTGSGRDFVTIRPGDKAATGGNNDIIHFAAGAASSTGAIVDGEAGQDTLVVQIGGSAPVTPMFENKGKGDFQITVQGKSILTRSIERFVFANGAGDIYAVYQPTPPAPSKPY